MVASTTAWLVGAGAFVGDFIQMSRMRNPFWLRGVGGAGKSRIQMVTRLNVLQMLVLTANVEMRHRETTPYGFHILLHAWLR